MELEANQRSSRIIHRQIEISAICVARAVLAVELTISSNSRKRQSLLAKNIYLFKSLICVHLRTVHRISLHKPCILSLNWPNPAWQSRTTVLLYPYLPSSHLHNWIFLPWGKLSVRLSTAAYGIFLKKQFSKTIPKLPPVKNDSLVIHRLLWNAAGHLSTWNSSRIPPIRFPSIPNH